MYVYTYIRSFDQGTLVSVKARARAGGARGVEGGGGGDLEYGIWKMDCSLLRSGGKGYKGIK